MAFLKSNQWPIWTCLWNWYHLSSKKSWRLPLLQIVLILSCWRSSMLVQEATTRISQYLESHRERFPQQVSLWWCSKSRDWDEIDDGIYGRGWWTVWIWRAEQSWRSWYKGSGLTIDRHHDFTIDRHQHLKIDRHWLQLSIDTSWNPRKIELSSGHSRLES